MEDVSFVAVEGCCFPLAFGLGLALAGPLFGMVAAGSLPSSAFPSSTKLFATPLPTGASDDAALVSKSALRSELAVVVVVFQGITIPTPTKDTGNPFVFHGSINDGLDWVIDRCTIELET